MQTIATVVINGQKYPVLVRFSGTSLLVKIAKGKPRGGNFPEIGEHLSEPKNRAKLIELMAGKTVWC